MSPFPVELGNRDAKNSGAVNSQHPIPHSYNKRSCPNYPVSFWLNDKIILGFVYQFSHHAPVTADNHN